MTSMREKWTDERLDDLNHRVDLGFDRVDRRFDSVDARLDRLEARMDSRFDSIQRTMVQAVIALTGGMLAGFAAMIALIATQL